MVETQIQELRKSDSGDVSIQNKAVKICPLDVPGFFRPRIKRQV